MPRNPADRPATERATEASRNALAQFEAEHEPSDFIDGMRAIFLAIEAEAAQGAAPLTEIERKLMAVLRHGHDLEKPGIRTALWILSEGSEGAAPRAEGLDYGEIWARWEEFADMAARSGSGFTQDQITGAAAMLTWLIDHEDRSIR